jgi:hypothetical protein
MNRGVALLALLAGAAFAVYIEANSSTIGAGDVSTITQDPSTWPQGDAIWDICRAVAQAEGYNQGQGAAPYDLNNPGDLSPGDEHGQATAGPAEFHGGSYIIHFATPDDGWAALYAKFSNIINGNSKVYGADWSWAQIGQTYAADPAWANHVAAILGVDPSSTPATYVELNS